ncbi:alginate export family protein [Brevundimonas naejangsanensis]|uniref:alginate export family protein n=1 Tax=Brevundimonas naejangsanensis TaxID=588932 RepID=UPI0004168B66|nr:alginate export family protein [Brevundimonas naejangsanensis]
MNSSRCPKNLRQVWRHTDQEAARVSDFIGERDTYSLRVAAKKGALTYDVEAMLQDGETAAGQDVEAWFVGFEGGYQLPGAWKPRIGARVDAGSGDDDASDDKAQGFDALWGRGQSFTTEFGYTNMVQAGLNLNLNPIPRLNANLGVTTLRRLSRDDGVYSLAPALIRGRRRRAISRRRPSHHGPR